MKARLKSHLLDVRRMNVALTRAKSSLFILGNAPTLERSNADWKEIVNNARARSLLTDVSYPFTHSNQCSKLGIAYRWTHLTSQSLPTCGQPGLPRQQRPTNSGLFPRLPNQQTLSLLRAWSNLFVLSRYHNLFLLLQSAPLLSKPLRGQVAILHQNPYRRDRLLMKHLRLMSVSRFHHHISDPRRTRVVSSSQRNPNHRCLTYSQDLVLAYHPSLTQYIHLDHPHRLPAQDIMYVYSHYYGAFNGGSSHWSGPNLGIVINTPALFLVGLVKVHSVGFPSVDNHAGLISVSPAGLLNKVTFKSGVAPYL